MKQLLQHIFPTITKLMEALKLNEACKRKCESSVHFVLGIKNTETQQKLSKCARYFSNIDTVEFIKPMDGQKVPMTWGKQKNYFAFK